MDPKYHARNGKSDNNENSKEPKFKNHPEQRQDIKLKKHHPQQEIKLTKDLAEKILFQHDYQKDSILDCLEIVHNYIAQHDLILTGGMAIDFALRKANAEPLYPDDKLPDYDFFSPNFHINAYQLGQVLAKKYDNVSTIRGRHVSTMRVRMNFISVADITYIPLILYDKIPTIKYEGIRIVHPWYQMIDQHKALSLPFEEPPMETIIGKRWKNDLLRYEMLYNTYPVKSDQKIDEKLIKLKYKSEQPVCVSGVAGIIYWAKRAEKDLDMKFPEVKGQININDEIECDLPNNCRLVIYTCYFKPTKNLFKRTLDKISERTIDKNYEIVNNNGHLISALKIDKHYVMNLQGILVHLLTDAILLDNEHLLPWYIIGARIFLEAAKQANEKSMIYLPTASIYGETNESMATNVLRQDLYYTLRINEKGANTPKNYYYDGKDLEKLMKYNPAESDLYQFDGQKI